MWHDKYIVRVIAQYCDHDFNAKTIFIDTVVC